MKNIKQNLFYYAFFCAISKSDCVFLISVCKTEEVVFQLHLVKYGRNNSVYELILIKRDITHGAKLNFK